MFAVGDEVVVQHGPMTYGPHRKRKVVKVFKRYVELDNGTKWGMNGLQWGSKPNYVHGRCRLVHWSVEHEKTNLRFDVIHSFDKQKEELTYEQLKSIWLIIGPDEGV